MFAPGLALVNLDTGGLLDTTYWNPNMSDSAVMGDTSYKICFTDGWHIFHARSNFYYKHWTVGPTDRTVTAWSAHVGDSTGSRGVLLPQFGAGINFVYSHKWLCKMPQRRELITFGYTSNTEGAGTVIGSRVQYGQAVDAGNFTDWGTFSQALAIASSDGSHTAFITGANYLDTSPERELFAAGAAYDHVNQRIWITGNLAGGRTYELSNLGANVLTSRDVGATGLLSDQLNGTYSRLMTSTRGGTTILIRSTHSQGQTASNAIEVMKVRG